MMLTMRPKVCLQKLFACFNYWATEWWCCTMYGYHTMVRRTPSTISMHPNETNDHRWWKHKENEFGKMSLKLIIYF